MEITYNNLIYYITAASLLVAITHFLLNLLH